LPLITEELHSWFGTIPAANKDGSDRGTQLMFLLFCYSSPLLMAAFLNLVLVTAQMLDNRNNRQKTDENKQWEME